MPPSSESISPLVMSFGKATNFCHRFSILLDMPKHFVSTELHRAAIWPAVHSVIALARIALTCSVTSSVIMTEGALILAARLSSCCSARLVGSSSPPI
eukprot:8891390-Pyramimonas_sp.AAC.1